MMARCDSSTAASSRREAFDRHRAFIVAGIASVVVAACAAPVARPAVESAAPPIDFPVAFYQQLAQRGGQVLQIEPAESLVVIEVRRAGSLANLGHDHVVASHDVRGYVAPSEGKADLYIRLDQLVVDEPALRAEAKFDTQPSESAIAGTRENMLGKFNAVEHPYALISVASVGTDATGTRLDASITLNGTTRPVRIPAKIERAADQLSITGQVELEQTAFGIAPFSILGGALQVQDRVNVRFAIRAHTSLP
jgi:YceI-like domain